MTDTAQPDAEMTPKKGGFLKKLIFFVLGTAVLGGGGFAAGLFYAGDPLSPAEEVLRLIEGEEMAEEPDMAGGGMQKTAKTMPDTSVFETLYYEFPDPLTTNLRGSRRFLQLSVGISTQYDEAVIENVETHRLALKSDMLAVVSGFSEEEVTGRDGRDALALSLQDAMNTRLERLEGFGGIEGVYFPSFVMQ